MTAEEARARFAACRVARLATLTDDGRPHVVPVCFAVEDDTVFTAVDHKPKRTAALRRLANIGRHPEVALLADHYDDDWDRLWWARADGLARVHDQLPRAIELLAGRYPQYARRPPAGPVIEISVDHWTGWAAG